MDFSFLSQPQQLQLPDPMAMALRGQTLANLSQQNQENAIRLENSQRLREGQDALSQVLPALQAAGYSKEAITAALQQNPKAAPFLLDYLDKKRTADVAYADKEADVGKKKADTEKTTSDSMLAKLRPITSQAYELANRATPPTSAEISQLYGNIAGIGAEKVVGTLPFQEWTNPDSVRQNLRTIGSAFFEAEKQAAQSEANRKNKDDSERGWFTARSEDRRRQDETKIGYGNLGVAQGNLAVSQARDKREAGAAENGKWTFDPARGVSVNAATGEARPVTGPDGKPIGTPKDAKAAQNAQKIDAILEQAEPLIDKATGSYGGMVRDQFGLVVGKSTEGATAIAELKALEGALMLAQPRMEGPQSDKDVALYRQMAAQIGDPTVPSEQKKAAMRAIRSLYAKYGEIDAGSYTPGAKQAHKVTSESEYNALPPGAEYTAPDGKVRRKR